MRGEIKPGEIFQVGEEEERLIVSSRGTASALVARLAGALSVDVGGIELCDAGIFGTRAQITSLVVVATRMNEA